MAYGLVVSQPKGDTSVTAGYAWETIATGHGNGSNEIFLIVDLKQDQVYRVTLMATITNNEELLRNPVNLYILNRTNQDLILKGSWDVKLGQAISWVQDYTCPGNWTIEIRSFNFAGSWDLKVEHQFTVIGP